LNGRVITTLRHLFTPHYTNNHRARLLHPVGLTVLLGIFILAQSSIQLLKAAPTLPGGFVLGFASNISPTEVVSLTNAKRAEQGLPSLQVSGSLNQAALAKANHMFQHDYWAHIAPDGTTPWTFIKSAGYRYSVAGENLARDFGDSGSMVSAWMDSPTHRENIVNAKYTEIGIAVVDGKLQGTETTLVVQMFGTPVVAQAQTTTTAVRNEPPQEVIVAVPTSVPELATLNAQAEPVVPEVVPQPIDPALTLSRISQPTREALPESRLSPLMLSKSISASLLLMLIVVLLYDVWVMKHKHLPRSVGKNWAHLMFYSIVLVIIMALSQGKVL
jgi:hypothetical protein